MDYKKLENQFMMKLLAYAGKDVSELYSRRNDFLSGKSMSYCKIKAVKFPRSKNMMEFESTEKAFNLGYEFGINIGIDTFNSIIEGMNNSKSLKHKKLLSKTILKKLRKSKTQ
ncbi:MAG: hypothetical protein HZB59_03940 [Ignavibacteriales bacterium]|nr:hypothetical protein [Ignavibacteriales bacterium]